MAVAEQAVHAEMLAKAQPDGQLVIPTLTLPDEKPRYPLATP